MMSLQATAFSGFVATVISDEADVTAGASTLPAHAAGNSVGDWSAALVLIVVALFAALLLFFWRVVRVPVHAPRLLIASFMCPAARRRVTAEFEVDATNRRIDVRWCTAHRPAVFVTCTKSCIGQGTPTSTSAPDLADLDGAIEGCREAVAAPPPRRLGQRAYRALRAHRADDHPGRADHGVVRGGRATPADLLARPEDSATGHRVAR